MIPPLPVSIRLLLTLALLLPTILPALADDSNRPPAASTSTLAAPFDSPLPTPTPAPTPQARLALDAWADPAWTEPGDVGTFIGWGRDHGLPLGGAVSWGA